jgi:hypothetical protein
MRLTKLTQEIEEHKLHNQNSQSMSGQYSIYNKLMIQGHNYHFIMTYIRTKLKNWTFETNNAMVKIKRQQKPYINR